MIKRLNQLPLYAFVDLSCGNRNVLLEPNEKANEEDLKKCASKLIVEYKSIANPSGLKAILLDREELIKNRAKILLFKLCKSLIAIDNLDEVREVLSSMQYCVEDLSDEQVARKIDELLRSAVYEEQRDEDLRKNEVNIESSTPDQIRASFDAEIAFLMTFYKMNIDVYNTNAAVYANIVHQAEISIRSRIIK